MTSLRETIEDRANVRYLLDGANTWAQALMWALDDVMPAHAAEARRRGIVGDSPEFWAMLGEVRNV